MENNKKTNKRNTKKTRFIPKYVVDFTDFGKGEIRDIVLEFAFAKFNNGICPNVQEMATIFEYMYEAGAFMGVTKGIYFCMFDLYPQAISEIIKTLKLENSTKQKSLFDKMKSKLSSIFHKNK